MLQYFKLFDEEEIEKIHNASVQILEQVGFEIKHPVAQDRLASNGARIDKEKNRVYMPEALIEKCLAQTPEEFVLSGRTSEFDFATGGNNPPFVRTATGCISYYDMYNKIERNLKEDDIKKAAILVDALPNIGTIGSLTAQDVPPEIYDIVSLRALLENTRKPIWALTESSKNLPFQFEMLEAVAGSKEAVREGKSQGSGIVCPLAPLRVPDEEVERALLYADYRLPVRVPVHNVMGANTPATIAGSIAQTNAEFLGMVVLLQTIQPHTPMWYYCVTQVLDMATGKVLANSAESQIIYAAVAQLAKRYKVPLFARNGGTGCCQVEQVMMQAAQGYMIGLLLGIDEHGTTSINGSIDFSPHVAILHDEIFGYVKRITQKCPIDDDTLGIDAIKEATLGTNEFMTSKHTLKHVRSEDRFRSTLFNSIPTPEWINNPTTIVDRAQAKLDDILKNHNVPPLDDDVLKELKRIQKSAENTLLT